MRRTALSIIGAALCAVLSGNTALATEESAANASSGYFDAALAQASATWESGWNAVQAWYVGGIPTSIVTDRFEESATASELDLRNLMEVAGYSRSELAATIGIFPEFSTTFLQQRQMSESDRALLMRLLRKHKRAFGGPVAIAERLLVHSAMEINSSESIEVAKVVVHGLPLPSAEFVARSKDDSVLGIEASYLSRQIQDLKDTVIQGR